MAIKWTKRYDILAAHNICIIEYTWNELLIAYDKY